MSVNVNSETLLGTYLKDRRAKLDPAAFGFAAQRRRTPGLRREEVAQRANISPTWYTWLEQGAAVRHRPMCSIALPRRCCSPISSVNICSCLGLGRQPEVRYRKDEGVTPRLQRVLDALDPCPALIRTAIWNVVAWNQGAIALLTDYGAMPPEKRNILRYFFLDPRARESQYDWNSAARFIVGAFRVDAARAGAVEEVEPLVEELSRLSPEFKAMWSDNDVRSHGEAVKHLRHATLGPLSIEYSAFAVDGRPDLSMVVYNPATRKIKIKSLR